MELRAAGPSTPSVIYDEQGKAIDTRAEGGEPIHFVFEEIRWSSEISRDEAAGRLEVTFYPFKKVKSFGHVPRLHSYLPSHKHRPFPRPQVAYLPFPEAFSRAEAEGKLVHSVLLWGALDDQSC